MKVQIFHKSIPVFEMCINTRLVYEDFTSVLFSRFPAILKISGQYFRSGIFDLAVCSSSKTKQFPLSNKDK